MILLIDNYDSFSYNLYQLIGEINSDIKVIRNDEMTVDEIKALAPEYIILSPGPKRPEDAGVCIGAWRRIKNPRRLLGASVDLHGIRRNGYIRKTAYARQTKRLQNRQYRHTI